MEFLEFTTLGHSLNLWVSSVKEFGFTHGQIIIDFVFVIEIVELNLLGKEVGNLIVDLILIAEVLLTHGERSR